MATVDKNFRIKHGLVVEGSTGTINGNNILTENASDNYIINLIGGQATSTNTAGAVVKRDSNGDFAAGTISVGSLTLNGVDLNTRLNGMDQDAQDYASTAESNANSYTDSAISTEVTNRNNAISTAQSAAEDYADGLISQEVIDRNSAISTALSTAEGYADTAASNAQSAAEDYADSLASNYDAAGAANTAYTNAVADAATDATTKANNAESNANDYTDSAISTEVSNRNSAISTALNTAQGYADTAEDNANSYTDQVITNLNLAGTYDALGAASQALSDANSYTDGKVADLVDSAPALLDTLNELAAAIADNPNYASDVANLVGTKADTTYVDSEISDLDTAAQGYASTAQSNAESFATTAANNAQSAAESYADGVAATAQSNAEDYADTVAGTAQTNAQSYTDTAISNGNSSAQPSYQGITIGGYTAQVGNWVAAGTAGVQVTAFSYSASSYGSAEFLVRVMSNAAGHLHSQLSKVLVTTDGAGNVAITEYGIVTTNGSMGDVTADINGGNVRILVTPTYASSEVIVSGSLLAYND